jgi:hypothetical protein
MSWLFSRALVEAYSEATCSDGEPSAQSSGNPTQLAYLPPDRMTAFSRPSRSGMTFKPLTDDHGAAVLTSYLEAFPVKTSALQAEGQASTEAAAECGDIWRGSLARFDPDTSSWKTAQRSLLGDSDECSVTWPRAGMTAAGQCWELPTLELRTKETGSGLWPTPVRSDAIARRPSKNWNGTSDLPSIVWRRSGGEQNPQKPPVKLNPTWVEWLMGWPLGWTDLKPLATDKSHSAQQPHGDS